MPSDRSAGHEQERAFATLSEPSFAAIWTNPADEAYDSIRPPIVIASETKQSSQASNQNERS